ncbi:MAG: hypothetical protein M3123_00755 [Actinomycetota bacterium]|nr:hypothetical protein [Actinomycetota bacterium]
MNTKKLGEAALTGWRARVGESVASRLHARTPLGEEEARTLVGLAFLAVSILYVVRTLGRAARER